MPGEGGNESIREGVCGSCTACCTHLPIPAGLVSPGAKPAGLPCAQVGPTGCRIYSRRPQMCIDFRCAWLADETWHDRWRPDRSGLLCLREALDGNVPAAVMYESRPDARHEPVGEAILAELVETVAVVIVVDTEGRRRRIPGRWVPHAAHDGLRKPHFLERRAGSRPGRPTDAGQIDAR